MTRKEVKAIMKAEVKALAEAIRLGKTGRKPANLNDFNSEAYRYLDTNRTKFRHLHIVYCAMKGTSYDRIETPSKDNLPNEYLLEKIKTKYESMLDQEAAA